MNGRSVQRFCLILMACLALATCSKNDSGTPFPPTGIIVLRLNGTTGALDPAFAGGIVVIDDDPAQFDFANAVALQLDGKILSAGRTVFQGLNSIILIRQLTNGNLDPNFGTNGIVRTPIPGASTSASAIAVQPLDGKILVAGISFNQGLQTTSITLVRYSVAGVLETTFGGAGTGIVTAAIGPGQDSDTCGLVLQGTKIIVAGASTGNSTTASNGNVYLYRYDASGAPDTTFGTPPGTGVTITNLSAPAMSPAIALQADGKIVLVAGQGSFTGTAAPVQEVVLRYSVDGALDPTFGPGLDGKVITDIGARANLGTALLVQQSDQKIVTLGQAFVDKNADTSDISLVRYNTNGSLDVSFVGPTNNPNLPGIVTTDLGGFDSGFSIAFQSTTGKFIVAGKSGSRGLSGVAVLRYNSDGSLDNTTTFGIGAAGVAAPPLVGPSIAASGNAVVVQPGGNIIVAGFD